MRCLVVSRDKDFPSKFLLEYDLREYLKGATRFIHDSQSSDKYHDYFEMPHTREEACRNASEYTLQVRQPYLNTTLKGTMYDLEDYTMSINDRGGRLSCTFPRRIDINVGDIVYMIYTTTKCSKIAGRFEVESVSTTNTATTINALDTVAILNTMTVSLSIGSNITPEITLEYLGEQCNIPLYVCKGTELRFSPGGPQLNSRPRDIIDGYINSNTTVCLDDLGVVSIRPIDFKDYYITLGACKGDWSLDVQFHDDYLTRVRLINPLDQDDNVAYWDYGAELLFGKTHGEDNAIRPLTYMRYKIGEVSPLGVQWMNSQIDSGEYSTVENVVDIPQVSHMMASKKRMSYILTAKDLPVSYDLCPGDVVIVCYQYGSDSPKNCLMRIREITFINDRMILKGLLHLTQHPIMYAPVRVVKSATEISTINIDVMPDIDIHRWQLANPNE